MARALRGGDVPEPEAPVHLEPAAPAEWSSPPPKLERHHPVRRPKQAPERKP